MKLTTTQTELLANLKAATADNQRCANDNDARCAVASEYARSTVRGLERRGLIAVERYWTTETLGWNGTHYRARQVEQYRTITVK